MTPPPLIPVCLIVMFNQSSKCKKRLGKNLFSPNPTVDAIKEATNVLKTVPSCKVSERSYGRVSRKTPDKLSDVEYNWWLSLYLIIPTQYHCHYTIELLPKTPHCPPLFGGIVKNMNHTNRLNLGSFLCHQDLRTLIWSTLSVRRWSLIKNLERGSKNMKIFTPKHMFSSPILSSVKNTTR